MTRTLAAASLAALLLATGVARAQTIDYAAFEELFGEPVTASVTGSPQRASQVAATMVIITAEDIRRSGAQDIPSVLQQVPGLDTLQPTRDHWDVSIRGYNEPFSPRLLVLVDGRQVYADYYGFTPWSTLPVELSAIRQIEVVKGPNSALFGFNAVAGVVNIVTYGPLDEPVQTLSVTGGSGDYAGASAVANWRLTESLGLRLSAGLRDNDDFSTAINPADAGIRRGNERRAASLALAWQAADHLRFGLEGTYSEAEQPILAPLYRLIFDRNETDSLKAYAAADTRVGLLKATVYTNHIESESFIGEETDPGLSPDNRVTVAQLESISKLGPAHTLRLSAEFRDNAVDTTRVEGGEVSYQVAAAGTMWEWRINSAVTLTTAARLDRWDLERSGSVPEGYPLTNGDWDRTDTELSYNAGVVWQAGENDTLRFLAGRGVQLPNLLSLGGLVIALPFGAYASGVPDLDPARVDNYEISWDRTLPRLGAALRISTFLGHSRDVMANAGGARPAENLFGLPVNLGDSRTAGVEISLDGRFREDWRWGLSYTGQTVDDDFDGAPPAESTLVAFEETTPRHQFRARLGWSRGPWEVDGHAGYKSRFDSFVRVPAPVTTGSLDTVPGYFTLDGRLAYRIGDRFTLAVSGQNLNRAEQQETQAPDVERVIFGTLSVDLGPRP